MFNILNLLGLTKIEDSQIEIKRKSKESYKDGFEHAVQSYCNIVIDEERLSSELGLFISTLINKLNDGLIHVDGLDDDRCALLSDLSCILRSSNITDQLAPNFLVHKINVSSFTRWQICAIATELLDANKDIHSIVDSVLNRGFLDSHAS